MSERSCFIENQVSDNADLSCKGPLYGPDNSTYIVEMDTYFFNKTVCCQPVKFLADWIKKIGQAIGETEIFKTYAQQIEVQTKEIAGEFEGVVLTVPKYDGHLLLEKSVDDKPIGRDELLFAFDKRHI